MPGGSPHIVINVFISDEKLRLKYPSYSSLFKEKQLGYFLNNIIKESDPTEINIVSKLLQVEQEGLQFLDGLNKALQISFEKKLNITEEYLVSYRLPRLHRLITENLDEYIEQLAEAYFFNEKTPTAELLNRIKHPGFTSHYDYIVDFNKALIISGRKNLKYHLSNIEVKQDFTISDNEILSAISSIERESLKTRLRNIDANREEDIELINRFPSYTAVTNNAYEKGKNRKSILQILKPFAIAAAFVGVLLVVIYSVYPDSNENGRYAYPSIVDQLPKQAVNVKILSKSQPEPTVGNQIVRIEILDIRKVVDSLESLLEFEKIANIETSPRYLTLSSNLDSLKNVPEGYRYDAVNHKLYLNLKSSINPNNIALLNIIESNSTSNLLHIRLHEEYYPLEVASYYKALMKEKRRKIIERLNELWLKKN